MTSHPPGMTQTERLHAWVSQRETVVIANHEFRRSESFRGGYDAIGSVVVLLCGHKYTGASQQLSMRLLINRTVNEQTIAEKYLHTLCTSPLEWLHETEMSAMELWALLPSRSEGGLKFWWISYQLSEDVLDLPWFVQCNVAMASHASASKKKDRKTTTLQDFDLSTTLGKSVNLSRVNCFAARSAYDIIPVLVIQFSGTGTFGRVLLARDRRNTTEFYALKIMNISEVIRLKQVEHVQNEKNILSRIEHPFIVNL